MFRFGCLGSSSSGLDCVGVSFGHVNSQARQSYTLLWFRSDIFSPVPGKLRDRVDSRSNPDRTSEFAAGLLTSCTSNFRRKQHLSSAEFRAQVHFFAGSLCCLQQCRYHHPRQIDHTPTNQCGTIRPPSSSSWSNRHHDIVASSSLPRESKKVTTILRLHLPMLFKASRHQQTVYD